MSVCTEQLGLFTAQPTGELAGPRPRPVDEASRGAPEFVEIAPGTWAMCVFGPIPKNGFGHLDFPHYWGGPQESPRWRVARHGDVPDGTFIFTTAAEAREVVAEVFGDSASPGQFMGWIEIPSDDLRRRGNGSYPSGGAS